MKVLVADGQALFAEAVGRALGMHDDIDVIAEYPTRGGAALAAIEHHRPDVVVYDHWMLEVDGPAAASAAAACAPGAKMLLLSGIHGPHHIQAALAAGAVGFLPKSLRLDQLVEAVRRADAGAPLVFGDDLAALIDGLEERLEAATERAERISSLTPREIEVLQALAGGRSLTKVADRLGISLGTAKNHLHRILAKTATTTQLEAVRMARLGGLISDGGRHQPIAEAAASEGQGTPATRNGTFGPAIQDGRPCTILVADTQRLFAEALGHCLSQEPGFAVLASFPVTGLTMAWHVDHFRPDVVIYDMDLRGLPAPAGVPALSCWSPTTKPVLLSWFDGRPQARRALENSSVALSKSTDLAAVAEAVRAAHARPGEEQAAELGEVLATVRSRPALSPDDLERILTLSPKDVQLVQLLALGWPAKRIAQELCLARGTVKNRIHQVMARTQTDSQGEVVALARAHGFLD